MLDNSVIRWGKSVNEMVAHVEGLLERPPETLFDIGSRARDFARVNLASPVVFQKMFDDICAIRTEADGHRVADLS
ncbi:MAG: hypothetical protein KY432_03575 [Acidobacteria bacterium]|nr:hypothetical protein [Acidobacteriota bacterium]